MSQAIQTYRNNTDQAPSPYHIHAIEQAFREMCSRSIGQSFKRRFPSFVVGDKGASIDSVAMRKGQDGPLSKALKDTDKDAIRMAIEDPGHGGPTWIGFHAFDKMASALEDHLKKVDKGGNRPNQISWIRQLNSEAWIN